MANCTAVLHHGPGHQSRTPCDVDGPHTVHHCIYGEFIQEAEWEGGDAITGVMDEPSGIHAAPVPEKSYIASTDINAQPHVTVQWTGDRLEEITVNNLKDGEPLTWREFQSAWATAHQLYDKREEC